MQAWLDFGFWLTCTKGVDSEGSWEGYGCIWDLWVVANMKHTLNGSCCDCLKTQVSQTGLKLLILPDAGVIDVYAHSSSIVEW